MGKLTFYGYDASPPVRAVLLTLKALDLPFEYVQVNLRKGEQMNKEYLKKNPQHTVPTLVDDEHSIWYSHAIMAYLVRRYGKDDSLYPKDYFKRAVVDQRLHFETGAVFQNAIYIIKIKCRPDLDDFFYICSLDPEYGSYERTVHKTVLIIYTN